MSAENEDVGNGKNTEDKDDVGETLIACRRRLRETRKPAKQCSAALSLSFDSSHLLSLASLMSLS